MKLTFSLAWRNLRRNPRRTFLTVGAMVFTAAILMFFMALQSKSYETGIRATTSLFHGHLQIQAPGYHERASIRAVISDPELITSKLAVVTNIEAMAIRAAGFALASTGDRSYGVQILGVQPLQEPTVSSIPGVIRAGRALTSSDSTAVLLGTGLARNLKVDIGDEITVLGQGFDGTLASAVFEVVGIFETGSQELDRGLMQVPLSEIQQVYSLGDAAHSIVIRVKDFERLTESKEVVRGIVSPRELTVLSWEELLPGVKQSMQLDMSAGWLFFLALILVVAFSILNTFLMSVLERTREFGVLLALGVPPQRLFWLLVTEGLLLGLFGAFLGLMCGGFVVGYFTVYGFSIPGTDELRKMWNLPFTIYPELSLSVVITGPLILFGTALVMSMFPARRAARTDMVNALKGGL